MRSLSFYETEEEKREPDLDEIVEEVKEDYYIAAKKRMKNWGKKLAEGERMPYDPLSIIKENQEAINNLPGVEEDDDEFSEAFKEILEVFRKRKEEKDKDPLRDWSCEL
jgi:hypothetical protein